MHGEPRKLHSKQTRNAVHPTKKLDNVLIFELPLTHTPSFSHTHPLSHTHTRTLRHISFSLVPQLFFYLKTKSKERGSGGMLSRMLARKCQCYFHSFRSLFAIFFFWIRLTYLKTGGNLKLKPG